MFGIVRRRKPIIIHQWMVPLLDFSSDPEAFYKAIEDEFATRQVPEATVERVDFRQAGLLSGRRLYLRILRERMAVDLCSAPFGTSWYFSCRVCELPRPAPLRPAPRRHRHGCVRRLPAHRHARRPGLRHAG